MKKTKEKKPKFRTFARHKTYTEVAAQCRKQRVPLNDELYRTRGFDTVMLGDKNAGWVIYNTFNGHFFGKTPKGKTFSHTGGPYERAAWYQALLQFFYVE